MILRCKRPSMKAKENKEFENELKSKERWCNNCLLQSKLRQSESVKMKEARLKKDAKNKTIKRLPESPEVREWKLSKDATLKATKCLLESPEVRGERLYKDAALKTLIFDFVNLITKFNNATLQS